MAAVEAERERERERPLKVKSMLPRPLNIISYSPSAPQNPWEGLRRTDGVSVFRTKVYF